MNRIDRLMGIILTIQSKKFVLPEALGEKYKLSIRTVYRDIKALNEIGVPIYFEPSRGYAIMEGHFLPPVLFTIDEANALLFLRALAEKFSDKSVAGHADTALEKIRAVLKRRDFEKLERLAATIKVYEPNNNTLVQDHIAKIQQVISEQKCATIQYSDGGGRKTKRSIEPIGLIFYTNQWHLIAWCQLRQAYRDFKVNRIHQFVPSSEAFSRVHTYSIEEYMKKF